MEQSYRRFIALGVLFLVVGVVAGGYLLARSTESTIDVVPTEQQVLAEVTVTTAGSGTRNTTAAGTGARTVPSTTAAAVPTTRPAKDASGFTIVQAAQLPKEAQQTLALIEKGGPYPYERDGIVFQNREKILPKQNAGYYREYTVVTPGSVDRGARRIVAGANRERYYTADHYESFVRIEGAR